jgi:DNA-binding NtrC family response regulator
MLQDKKILIVEDEFLIALELEKILLDAGASVIGPACTASKALEIIEHRLPDFAILDFRLGSGTSLPIAARLRSLAIPFLIHTGQGDLSEVTATWPDVTILHKPVPAELLVRTVGRLIQAVDVTRMIA